MCTVKGIFDGWSLESTRRMCAKISNSKPSSFVAAARPLLLLPHDVAPSRLVIVAKEERGTGSRPDQQHKMSHIERRYDAEVMRHRARGGADRRRRRRRPPLRQRGRVDMNADNFREAADSLEDSDGPPIRTLELLPLPDSFRRVGDLEDRVPQDCLCPIRYCTCGG